MKFPAVFFRGGIGTVDPSADIRTEFDLVSPGEITSGSCWDLSEIRGGVDPDLGRQVGWLRVTLHKTFGVGDIGTPQGLLTGGKDFLGVAIVHRFRGQQAQA